MGIDNGFGANVLPSLIFGFFLGAPLPSYDTTQALRDGQFTLLIQSSALAPQSNATNVATQVFVGGVYDHGAPAFGATTDWPVLTSSLQDGATIAGGALLRYEGFIESGTFFSGAPAGKPLLIPMIVVGPVVLRIHHATISFVRSATDPRHLTHGVIAGVLQLSELLTALAPLPFFDVAGCNNPEFTTLFQSEMPAAQDILADGTNKAGVACDAISIGIGFTAVQVANPTKVTTTDATTSPCPMP